MHTEFLKPEGKRTLGIPRHRRQDKITMDLTETVWEVVNSIRLAKDRYQWWALMNMVINLRVSYEARNFVTG
jgi:hypothetical protein